MVSVVMATYNGAEFIVDQLDSIRRQTITPDEVVICDDQSKDDTVEIIRNYIEKYSLFGRWKVYCNEKNLGYADNFDKAVHLAVGDFIFFSDQDDLWAENKIEIMLGIMEKKLDCQVLCTDYEPFFSSADAPRPPKSILKKMPDNGILEKISITKQSVYIGALGCCMCVRKKFYQKIESYWFKGWAQDDRMWRMAQCVDGCYLLHSNLVKHRLHGNNTATYGKFHTVKKRIKLFRDMQKANYQMLQILKDGGKSGSDITVIEMHIRMMDLRIKLLEDRKLSNILTLITYLPYYQKAKSLLLEVYLAIKRD